jgi:hypothetical protein
MRLYRHPHCARSLARILARDYYALRLYPPLAVGCFVDVSAVAPLCGRDINPPGPVF